MSWDLLGCPWGVLGDPRGAPGTTFENLYGEESALRCSLVPKRDNHQKYACFIRKINKNVAVAKVLRGYPL